jgi:hypothetical protein
MGRVRGVLVAGVVALAVSVVAAGPAVAAKGGNSDNAHACQQGGHENRFEAETGNPFKNAGDCASHGAQGGATSTLQFLTVPTYPCSVASGTCWGIVSGSGLRPQADWFVIDIGTAPPNNLVARGVTEVDGSLPPTAVDVGCGEGAGPFKVQTLTPGGRVFVDVNAPC